MARGYISARWRNACKDCPYCKTSAAQSQWYCWGGDLRGKELTKEWLDDPEGKCPIGAWEDIEPDDIAVERVQTSRRYRSIYRDRFGPIFEDLYKQNPGLLDKWVGTKLPLWLYIEISTLSGEDVVDRAAHGVKLLRELDEFMSEEKIEEALSECILEGSLSAQQAEEAISDEG